VDYDRLQIELTGSGIEIRGDPKQIRPLSENVLSYNWTWYFKESGTLAATLKATAIGPRRNERSGRFNIQSGSLGSITWTKDKYGKRDSSPGRSAYWLPVWEL
jgi:hypothetical protein